MNGKSDGNGGIIIRWSSIEKVLVAVTIALLLGGGGALAKMYTDISSMRTEQALMKQQILDQFEWAKDARKTVEEKMATKLDLEEMRRKIQAEAATESTQKLIAERLGKIVNRGK